VQRANFYDPELNRSYGRMAEHYGIGILPARPLKPKGALANAGDTVFSVKGFMPSRSDAGCHRARSGQGHGAPLARGPAALLDLPCARRPAGGQIGTTG